MTEKIKINIPGFGDKECGDDVEYELINDLDNPYYVFLKKGTLIIHNEYGPAWEYKDGSYAYYIDNLCHRTDGPAYYNAKDNIKKYIINQQFAGNSEDEFKYFLKLYEERNLNKCIFKNKFLCEMFKFNCKDHDNIF